jgi:hypothetical protein
MEKENHEVSAAPKIVIECTPRGLFKLFDCNAVMTGMTREVPGGATIQLGEMPMEKRGVPQIEASLVAIAISFGSGIAINIFPIGSMTNSREKIRGAA